MAKTLDYEQPSEKRRSFIGRVFKVAFIVGTLVEVFLVFCVPIFEMGLTEARYSQCKNNLKQIGLALKAYNDEYGRLPPAYVTDSEGRRLHSWRVLILPYLGERQLYEEIILNEPWDSPKNSQLHARMPNVFRCPASDYRDPGFIHYRAVVGDDCWMTATGKHSLSQLDEGVAASVLVGECRRAINWMETRDVAFEDMKSWDDGDNFLGPHEPEGGGILLFADGEFSRFRASVARVSIEVLKDECSLSRSSRMITY